MIYGEDSAAAREYGEELAAVAEARFNLAAQSPDCWFDAGGMMTFTDQVRLVVGSAALSGEAFGTAEWLDTDPSRPFKTAIQMIQPIRVSNKDGIADENRPNGDRLRRGIVTDRRGRPKSFQIIAATRASGSICRATIGMRSMRRSLGAASKSSSSARRFKSIRTRGLSKMVAALGAYLHDQEISRVTLQNAVVNASYAAAVESELPERRSHGVDGRRRGRLDQRDRPIHDDAPAATCRRATTSPSTA